VISRGGGKRSDCVPLLSVPSLKMDGKRVSESNPVSIPISVESGAVATKVCCWEVPRCGDRGTYRVDFTLAVSAEETDKQLSNPEGVLNLAMSRISTPSLTAQPHKILGLAEMVTQFYRGFSGQMQNPNWTSIILCRQ